MFASFRQELAKRRSQSTLPKCPRCESRAKVVPIVYGGSPPTRGRRIAFWLALRLNQMKASDSTPGIASPTHYCKKCKQSFQYLTKTPDGRRKLPAFSTMNPDAGPVTRDPNFRLPPNVKVKK